MTKKDIPTISVGQLRQVLSGYPDDYELNFGGLTFYRVKERGPKLLQVEFDQTVYLTDEGRVVVENPE